MQHVRECQAPHLAKMEKLEKDCTVFTSCVTNSDLGLKEVMEKILDHNGSDGWLTDLSMMAIAQLWCIRMGYVMMQHPIPNMGTGVVFMDSYFPHHLRVRHTRNVILAVQHINFDRIKRILYPANDQTHWWACCIDFEAKEVQPP